MKYRPGDPEDECGPTGEHAVNWIGMKSTTLDIQIPPNVRNAMTMFPKWRFPSGQDRREGARKILAKAAEFHMHVDPKSKVAQVARESDNTPPTLRVVHGGLA